MLADRGVIRSVTRCKTFATRDLVVERFDRRGTEPFELFTSEFGQDSVRIQESLLEFIRNPKISGMFNIF